MGCQTDVVSDDELPWQREADNKLDTKYPYGKLISNYRTEPIIVDNLKVKVVSPLSCTCIVLCPAPSPQKAFFFFFA